MSGIQFEYSTLSTSLTPSEFGSNMHPSLDEDISEESSSERSTSPLETPSVSPPDKFNFVYIVFGLLGITTLLPWNFFITAHDYWMYKFRDGKNESCTVQGNTTDLQADFTTYLAVATNVPYVILLVLCTFYMKNVPQMRRVIASLLMMIFTFSCITALVEVDSDQWQHTFFTITMILVVSMGIFSAILQAATTSVASILPPRYLHSLFMGQAIAGIIASLLQIVSLFAPCSSQLSAFVYFICADITLFLALISYSLIQKSDFFRFHLFYTKGVTALTEISGAVTGINVITADVSVFTVLKWVWPYAASILIVFWVTLGIFPGLAVLVVSEHVHSNSIWTGRLFLPLSCFLLFNMGDFCGRTIGGWFPFPASWRYRLLFLCVLRVVFVPLFMLCNALPRYHLQVVFTSDVYYITFISLLAVTNGFFATVAMIGGTKSVNPELQEVAGVVLSTFLGTGLMLGSFTSYVFVQLL